jgi:hypothetical protein
MRVGWSTEVSLLVVALYTMRQAFALEILTLSLQIIEFTEPSAIFAFSSTSP